MWWLGAAGRVAGREGVHADGQDNGQSPVLFDMSAMRVEHTRVAGTVARGPTGTPRTDTARYIAFTAAAPRVYYKRLRHSAGWLGGFELVLMTPPRGLDYTALRSAAPRLYRCSARAALCCCLWERVLINSRLV